MANYIDIMYDKKIKPKTKYPYKFCSYLFSKFKMKKDMILMDVGCGRGDFMKEFEKLGLKTIGLDHGKSDVENLDIDIKRVDFERDSFPLADNSIDIAFSKSVIEHLHKPQNFVQEIYRVLKPGGKFILMTPDWQSQRYIFYNDYTHVQPYITSGLANLLKIFDFKEVHSELFYQLPFVWKNNFLKLFLKPMKVFFPVKKINKNNFWRWSRELMILGSGIKK